MHDHLDPAFISAKPSRYRNLHRESWVIGLYVGFNCYWLIMSF